MILTEHLFDVEDIGNHGVLWATLHAYVEQSLGYDVRGPGQPRARRHAPCLCRHSQATCKTAQGLRAEAHS